VKIISPGVKLKPLAKGSLLFSQAPMQKQRKGPRGPRRMFRPREGEKWICSKCGGEIKELPFIPSADRPVYHRECLPSRN
jgi:CxxC-x17-CxxC domain-containing protein